MKIIFDRQTRKVATRTEWIPPGQLTHRISSPKMIDHGLLQNEMDEEKEKKASLCSCILNLCHTMIGIETASKKYLDIRCIFVDATWNFAVFNYFSKYYIFISWKIKEAIFYFLFFIFFFFFWGSGVLGLPYAFAKIGFLWGFVLFFISAILSMTSLFLLSKVSEFLTKKKRGEKLNNAFRNCTCTNPTLFHKKIRIYVRHSTKIPNFV